MKQPLQTAVTIDASDFEDFHAEEKLHIAISVKDFRNIILHADGLRTSVTALYSQPAHPLQFSYGAGGMQCEFTLMTIGDFRNSSASSTLRSNARENTNGAPTRTFVQSRGTNMPPPAARQSSTPSQARRLGSRQMVNAVRTDPAENPESLFLPEDDDSRWDPQEDRGEDDDMLAWDASADNVSVITWQVMTAHLTIDRMGRDTELSGTTVQLRKHAMTMQVLLERVALKPHSTLLRSVFHLNNYR